MRYALVALAVMGAACHAPRRVPFVESSLDANRGAPHAVALHTADADDVANRLVVLFGERGVTVIDKQCVGAICNLVLSSGVDQKAAAQRAAAGEVGRLRATQPGQQHRTVTREQHGHESKIFVRVAQSAQAVHIWAVGVPILDGDQACPRFVASYFEACSPPILQTLGDAPLADTVRRQQGHDVSGAVEAELIRSVLAQLLTPSLMVQ